MIEPDRFTDALVAASELHQGQVRKGTSIPYVSHLLATCAIALEHGANEDQAIAALLHDVLEDVPGEAARERVESFGGEVVRIVEACTDGFAGRKDEWKARKQRYLEHLAGSDRAVLLVSASDKLHNARSLLEDLQVVGSALWDRFTVTDPEEQLWYYEGLVEAYRGNAEHHPGLVAKLDETVRDIARFVRRDFQPIFHLEKIECLVLAANLERDGWTVRLSVPPGEVDRGPEKTGIDWARAVAHAQDLKRPLQAADRAAARSIDIDSRRAEIAAGLIAWLKATIDADRGRLSPSATDSAYRYDGIWHDTSGNIDLVAWRGSETLLVEAKGVTVRGGRINREKAAEDIAETLKRLARWGRRFRQASLAVLAPDDRQVKPATFTTAVGAHWAYLRDARSRTTVYLVTVDGTLSMPAAEDLR